MELSKAKSASLRLFPSLRKVSFLYIEGLRLYIIGVRGELIGN